MQLTVSLHKILFYEPCITGYMKLLNKRLMDRVGGGTFSHYLQRISLRYVLDSNGLDDMMWLVFRMMEDTHGIDPIARHKLNQLLNMRRCIAHDDNEFVAYIKNHFDYTEIEKVMLMGDNKPFGIIKD